MEEAVSKAVDALRFCIETIGALVIAVGLNYFLTREMTGDPIDP